MVSPLAALAGGALAFGFLQKQLRRTDADHDGVLERAYRVAEAETDPEAKIYVDHIHTRSDVSADGHPKSQTPGDAHVPDLIVNQFEGPNLVAEVETDGTVDAEAISQIEDFATSGYTRVLIVPKGVTDEAVSQLDGVDGKVVVTHPKALSKLL